MTQGKSIEMCLILYTKAFVGMTASRRLLYGETSCIHCSAVILAHFPQCHQILKVFWASYINSDFYHLHHPGTVGVGTEPANIHFHC